MDVGAPATDLLLRRMLDDWAALSGSRYHGLRHRHAGNVIWVEVHLLLPGQQELENAHAAATKLEHEIEAELAGAEVVVTTHLEPLEQHANHHPVDGREHV